MSSTATRCRPSRPLRSGATSSEEFHRRASVLARSLGSRPRLSLEASDTYEVSRHQEHSYRIQYDPGNAHASTPEAVVALAASTVALAEHGRLTHFHDPTRPGLAHVVHVAEFMRCMNIAKEEQSGLGPLLPFAFGDRERSPKGVKPAMSRLETWSDMLVRAWAAGREVDLAEADLLPDVAEALRGTADILARLTQVTASDHRRLAEDATFNGEFALRMLAGVTEEIYPQLLPLIARDLADGLSVEDLDHGNGVSDQSSATSGGRSLRVRLGGVRGKVSSRLPAEARLQSAMAAGASAALVLEAEGEGEGEGEGSGDGEGGSDSGGTGSGGKGNAARRGSPSRGRVGRSSVGARGPSPPVQPPTGTTSSCRDSEHEPAVVSRPSPTIRGGGESPGLEADERAFQQLRERLVREIEPLLRQSAEGSDYSARARRLEPAIQELVTALDEFCADRPALEGHFVSGPRWDRRRGLKNELRRRATGVRDPRSYLRFASQDATEADDQWVFVLDRSGSMSGGRPRPAIDFVQDLAVVALEAFRRTRARRPYALLAFSDVPSLLKDMDRDLTPAQERGLIAQLPPSGGTNDVVAFEMALAAHARGVARKRITVFLTDGDGQSGMRTRVEAAERRGKSKVIGMGFGEACKPVVKVFPRHIVVEDVTTLVREFIKMIRAEKAEWL